MKRTIILITIIGTSSILIGQRNEDLKMILPGNLFEVYSTVIDTHNYENLKHDSFFFEVVKLPIVFWQGFISSQMKPRCYFHPSCSRFSFEAIRQYGLLGFFFGLDRISRCNVFSEEKYPYYENTQRLYDPVEHYGGLNKISRKYKCRHD